MCIKSHGASSAHVSPSLDSNQITMKSVQVVLALGLALFGSLASSQYHEEHHEEHHEPRQYKFEYGVHDVHTGDVKSHHESHDGHGVKGYYKVKEADGRTREVIYAASKHGGFNAIVKHSGHPAIHHGFGAEGPSDASLQVSLEAPKHVFAVHHKHGVSNQYFLFGHHGHH